MAEPLLRVRVPGKAMLAGEYAVLAGAPGIVCAVDRHLTCEVFAADALEISGAGTSWREGMPDDPALKFATAALRIAQDYARGKARVVPPVRFAISDELRAPDGTKLGLGGSACTVVAVTGAALAAAKIEAEKSLVFRLAAIAHGAAQGTLGSALDVAASAFGGVLWTRRFDVAAAIAAWRAAPAAIGAIVERIAEPERERLPAIPMLLAFSGRSASTGPLVQQVERFAAASPREWGEFVARTSAACARLRGALEAHHVGEACRAFEVAGGLLDELGRNVGADLVTEEHRRIAALAREVGAAAKISGAGGGDCSIAIGAPAALDALSARLREHGVLVVWIGVDEGGLDVVANGAGA